MRRLALAVAAITLLAAPASAQDLGFGLSIPVLAMRPIVVVVHQTVTGLDFSDANNSQYIPLF